jgi:hypothetical protein
MRAGVVGTGFIGVVHVDALRRLGIEVAGVVGSTPDRAEAKRIAPVYPSYDALLDDRSVDVVHLTTPNHLHYPQVKQALAAGKHVVCEKPLATTAEESAELLELAERSGLVHCTNFNIRFYPMVQEAWARARGGDVGEAQLFGEAARDQAVRLLEPRRRAAVVGRDARERAEELEQETARRDRGVQERVEQHPRQLRRQQDGRRVPDEATAGSRRGRSQRDAPVSVVTVPDGRQPRGWLAPLRATRPASRSPTCGWRPGSCG